MKTAAGKRGDRFLVFTRMCGDFCENVNTPPNWVELLSSPLARSSYQWTEERLLLEFIENIQPLIDFTISVLALLALILFIGLMYKIYQVCVGSIEVFKFFIAYQSDIRELMIQIERFCRRYASIVDGEVSAEDRNEKIGKN